MKNDEIKLSIGLYTAEINEVLRVLRSFAQRSTPRLSDRQLEALRLEQESLRWATDPLGLMSYLGSPLGETRRIVGRVFWSVARFCDRCCEILDE